MLRSITATLDKDTITIDHTEYLVKGSRNNGMQALAEVIASRLAQVILYSTIEYTLIPKEEVPNVQCGAFPCLSKCPVLNDTMFQLGDYLEQMYPNVWALKTNNAIFNYLRKNEIVNTQQMVDVYYFDYIIGNRDRHWNNFSVMEDSYTLSPCYDYGESLLCWDKSLLIDLEDYSCGIKNTHEKSLQHLRKQHLLPNFKTTISNIWRWFDVNTRDLLPLVPEVKYNAIREYLCTRYNRVKHLTEGTVSSLDHTTQKLNTIFVEE